MFDVAWLAEPSMDVIDLFLSSISEKEVRDLIGDEEGCLMSVPTRQCTNTSTFYWDNQRFPSNKLFNYFGICSFVSIYVHIDCVNI